ncbi:MAG: HD domain-containing protein [Candidatus Altiarchaeota archaeon]
MDETLWEEIFTKEVESFNKKAPQPSHSHQLDHSFRVWKKCKILGEKLGGDLEILIAAAFCHDLGRQLGLEIHGEKSAELAIPILERQNFPPQKIPLVLDAIKKHDYTTPSTERIFLESQILYDADKMDAFGAIGVVRHINFHLNKGDSIEMILRNLRKRWDGLTLSESKEIIKKDYEFIVDFFLRLQKEIK